MLVAHLVSLLIRSAAIVPSRIGSNWGGIAFTIIVATLGAWFGSPEMTVAAWRTHWRKNLKAACVAALIGWVGLFVVSIVLTTYDDHQNLVGAAHRIRRDTDAQRDELRRQLQSVQNNAGQQVGDLKTSCAVKDGINRTLEKQNRDEQVLIAGCQNQALKLLVPEALKITPIVFDIVEDNAAMRTVRWLLLSNKETAPHVNITCGEGMTYMRAASLRIIGGAGAFFGGVSGRLGPTAWELSQGSGTWGPSNPLLVTLTYQGSADSVCSFTPR